MSRSICCLASICALHVCCGCVVVVPAPGAKYAFELEFEDETPEISRKQEYAVLTEVRQMSGPAIDNIVETSCRYRMLPSCDSKPTLAYTVPTRFITGWMIIPFIPQTAVSSEPEHTFTVFSPGYAATTVYPLGLHNNLPHDESERAKQRSGPALMKCGQRDMPLSWTKSDDGVYHSPLPLKRLLGPSSATKGEADLFGRQLGRLAMAIEQGALDRVDDATRKLVHEAVRQQHACCTKPATEWESRYSNSKGSDVYCSHLSCFDECSRQEGSPCKTIAEWSE